MIPRTMAGTKAKMKMTVGKMKNGTKTKMTAILILIRKFLTGYPDVSGGKNGF